MCSCFRFLFYGSALSGLSSISLKHLLLPIYMNKGCSHCSLICWQWKLFCSIFLKINYALFLSTTVYKCVQTQRKIYLLLVFGQLSYPALLLFFFGRSHTINNVLLSYTCSFKVKTKTS